MAFQQEKLQKTVLGKSREVLSSSDGPIRGQGQKPELGLPELHREPKAVWHGCSPLQQQDVAANGSVPVLRTHTHTHTRSPGVPRPVFHSSLAIPSRAAAAFPAMPCLTVSSAAHSWALTLGGHEAVQARLMCGQTHLSRSSKI